MPKLLTRWIQISTLSVSVLTLQACALLPDGVASSDLNELPTWIRQKNEQSTSSNHIEFTKKEWWKAAHDPILDQFIEEALKDSTTIRIAQAKTQVAMAQAGITESNRLPQFNVHGEMNKQKLSKNSYVPPAYAGVSQEQAQLSLGVNWDLDLWGRQRKAIAALKGQIEAKQAEQAMVALTLSTEITKAYVQLRWINATETVLTNMLAQHERMQFIQTTRKELGLDDGHSLDQAIAAQAQTQLQLEQLLGQKERYITVIEGLVGNAELVRQALKQLSKELPSPLLDFQTNQPIALSLLARRPDLVGQRFLVQAAADEVDYTRFAALPNINLTGYLGAQSLGWSKLTKPESRISLLGGVLDFPIFDSGRIRFQTEAKKAEFEAEKARYEGAITDAVQEVLNEVILLNQYKKEIAVQTTHFNSLQRQANRAKTRFKLGLDSEMPLIQAELALQAQQSQILHTQLYALGNQLDLVRALGGGYEHPQVANDIQNSTSSSFTKKSVSRGSK